MSGGAFQGYLRGVPRSSDDYAVADGAGTTLARPRGFELKSASPADGQLPYPWSRTQPRSADELLDLWLVKEASSRIQDSPSSTVYPRIVAWLEQLRQAITKSSSRVRARGRVPIEIRALTPGLKRRRRRWWQL